MFLQSSRAYCAPALVLSAAITAASLAASFQGIGTLPRPDGGIRSSLATAVSGDGRYVVGLSPTDPSHGDFNNTGSTVRWSAAGGLEDIGIGIHATAASPVRGPFISFDGQTISGTLITPGFRGFRWVSDGTFIRLPDGYLTGGMSDNGRDLAATRFGTTGGTLDRAGRFRASNGYQFEDLGFGSPAIDRSYALAMSPNGQAVAGMTEGVPTWGIYRWREGAGSQLLFNVSSFNDPPSYLTAISNDGSVLLGRSFRWTESGGFVDLTGVFEGLGMSSDGQLSLGIAGGQAAIRYPNGTIQHRRPAHKRLRHQPGGLAAWISSRHL